MNCDNTRTRKDRSWFVLDRAVEERSEALWQSHSLSNKECKFKGLVSIKAGVAVCVVTEVEVLLADLPNVTSGAFGDVLSGHLQVDSSWVCPHLCVHIEESSQLVSYSLEGSCLEAVAALHSVAVHRVWDPKHCTAFSLHSSDQLRKVSAKFFRTHSYNNSNSARDVVRVNSVDNTDQLLRSAFIRDFDANRVINASNKVSVSVVQLSGALSDPEHVWWAVVPGKASQIIIIESENDNSQQWG